MSGGKWLSSLKKSKASNSADKKSTKELTTEKSATEPTTKKSAVGKSAGFSGGWLKNLILSEKKFNGKYSNKLSREELINAESALGRTLFGPIPEGHQREFFAAEKNVWIWYENYANPEGVLTEMTVRYEVRPAGVYKRVNQGSYAKIEGEELNNFRQAAKSYLELVKTKLYC